MQGTSLPGDAGSDSARHRDDLAPRLAVVITAVVLVGYFCVAVTYVVDARPSGRALDAALLMLALLPVLAALLGLQLTHSFPGLAPRLSGARHWTLALQALLTFLPFAVFKHAWLGMPGFLAGSSLLVLPPPLSWVAFAAIMGCTDVLLFQVGFGWGEVAYTTVSTALTGLVVFGLSRLSGLVAEVSRSRAELARLAVAQERLRFARDLHDLLGYSLSTITLKCELVHRLVPRRTPAPSRSWPRSCRPRARRSRTYGRWPADTARCRCPRRRARPSPCWPRSVSAPRRRSTAGSCPTWWTPCWRACCGRG
ncbi:histidine kinase [Streptomyces sp. FXJ1.4098]|nr:histidine kinase [Streptomyces sp. FXJ1.4098]